MSKKCSRCDGTGVEPAGKSELTVVRVEWGDGYYRDGVLIKYHKDKWEPMSPQEIMELYADCSVNEVDMSGAEWEFSGDGFPERLEDAMNKDFNPFANLE